MPFFLSKSKKKKASTSEPTPSASVSPKPQVSQNANSSSSKSASNKDSPKYHDAPAPKPSNGERNREPSKLVFHCQLAHGSPTGIISGFSNVKELYQKVADCFEIPASTILYCTLNTHKIEMNKLLGGQIGLDDFIFAHVKGQPKEVEIVKSEAALGLTITDNGAGYAFIKRIKEGSVASQLQNLLKAGDHIEKIDDKSIVGSRHYEVANMLKALPVGSKFKLRLIEPNAFGFHVESAKRSRKTNDIKNGTKTLRFKADGKAVVEEVSDVVTKAIERINILLETYMGINDADLAQNIWDLSENKTNPSDFACAIDESELGSFNFTDEFIFDLWAAIDDVKVGRLRREKEVENERM